MTFAGFHALILNKIDRLIVSESWKFELSRQIKRKRQRKGSTEIQKERWKSAIERAESENINAIINKLGGKIRRSAPLNVAGRETAIGSRTVNFGSRVPRLYTRPRLYTNRFYFPLFHASFPPFPPFLPGFLPISRQNDFGHNHAP